MEPVTTFLLGCMTNAIYDIAKSGMAMTYQNIKHKLSDDILDEEALDKIAKRIEKLNNEENLEEKNERIIRDNLESDSELLELASKIQHQNINTQTVYQTHSGNGDNVAGNKIINNSDKKEP